MTTEIVELVWTIATLLAGVLAWWHCLDARKEMQAALDEDSERLMLSARIQYRNAGAWSFLFTAYFMVGVVALTQPNNRALEPADWINAVLLITGVVLVGGALVLGRRDARRQRELILQDIYARLRRDENGE